LEETVQLVDVVTLGNRGSPQKFQKSALWKEK